MASKLQEIWQAGGSPTALSSTPRHGSEQPYGAVVHPRHGSEQADGAPTVAPYGGAEEPLSVICGDAPNPRHPRTYVNLVADVVPRDGPIGLNALWADDECVYWPVSSPDVNRSRTRVDEWPMIFRSRQRAGSRRPHVVLHRSIRCADILKPCT